MCIIYPWITISACDRHLFHSVHTAVCRAVGRGVMRRSFNVDVSVYFSVMPIRIVLEEDALLTLLQLMRQHNEYHIGGPF